jgi:hypothetical protein
MPCARAPDNQGVAVTTGYEPWLWPFVMLRATPQLFPRIPARAPDLPA